MLDYKTLAGESQLIALEMEIARLTREMMAKELLWVFLADVPGKPDKKVRRIRPEYQAAYAAAMAQRTALLEKKVELERELGIEVVLEH
jgi:hypothetical protein